MTRERTRELSISDEVILRGYDDVIREEPEQLNLPFPSEESEEDKEESTFKYKSDVRQKAVDFLDQIKEMANRLDRKCAHLKVATNEEKGSDLYKAMRRVFQESTTTVTYDHYKRALAIRKQLVKEDQTRAKEL
jgi:hypothetical protein